MTTFDLTQKSITKNSLTKLSLTQMWYSLFKHRASMLVCVDKWEIFKIGKCSGRYVLKKEYYESRNV